MSKTVDVLVAGLGAMGAAAASALARRGVRVLGLDRFHPPHDRGSSHGESRVIRAAYFEHPLYVPLVRAAYDRWRALEARSGRRLLVEAGVLLVGQPGSELLAGARAPAPKSTASPTSRSMPHELARRYPMIVAPEGAIGLLEPGGGFLYPEACIEAFLAEAAARGAELHFDEPLESWRRAGDSIEVTTARDRYVAGPSAARHRRVDARAAAGPAAPGRAPGAALVPAARRAALRAGRAAGVPVRRDRRAALVRRARSRQRAQGRAPSSRRGRSPPRRSTDRSTTTTSKPCGACCDSACRRRTPRRAVPSSACTPTRPTVTSWSTGIRKRPACCSRARARGTASSSRASSASCSRTDSPARRRSSTSSRSAWTGQPCERKPHTAVLKPS